MFFKPQKTVFVAMSGGVDSSVAAALLKKQGFKVIGVFMKNWSETIDGITYCTSESDFADMRAVCQHLKIPFYTFNFEEEYKKRVLDYFFAEYKAGRTPNPDIMCNKEIKFGLFYERARALGADFIATGHYARRAVVGKNPDTIYQLLTSVDKIKDQTYFLYNLTEEILEHTLFPIGDYQKSEVRELAEKFKLPTARKKDSQGICFIGQVDVKKFLKTVISSKRGNIVNTAGKILGEHEGAWFYTIGQRRVEGLSGMVKPMYVVGTDIEKNLVIVGDESEIYNQTAVLEGLHLINDSGIRTPHSSLRATAGSAAIPYIQEIASSATLPRNDRQNDEDFDDRGWHLSAKSRYTPEFSSGTLEQVDNVWVFTFDQPERAVTPGQSLVLYDEEVCIGGGVIKSNK
jgi:tRNA-uridine 2-sulfurtransferase